MSQSQSLRINATFAQRRGSTAGFVGAVVIHVTIIAATLFSFAHKLDIEDQSTPIVPVDLVTIGDKNNIAPTITKQQKIEADQEIQSPQPDMVTPTIAPPEVQQEEAAAEPAPSDIAVPQKKPQPQPQTKPTPQPKADDKKKFDINNIMAMLDKQPSKAAAPNAKVANRAMKGIGAQDAATADLQTALASQIMACWSPPVGAPNANDLVVDFDLFLNPDGSVARPPQLTGDSAYEVAHNPFTRAAAEAARRAIFTCAPYKLPANRYNDWREINPFHFDPRQMMGQ
jgi:outer membrane biosynthesis protein TonB